MRRPGCAVARPRAPGSSGWKKAPTTAPRRTSSRCCKGCTHEQAAASGQARLRRPRAPGAARGRGAVRRRPRSRARARAGLRPQARRAQPTRCRARCEGAAAPQRADSRVAQGCRGGRDRRARAQHSLDPAARRARGRQPRRRGQRLALARRARPRQAAGADHGRGARPARRARLPEAPAEERGVALPDAREPRAAQGRPRAPAAHQALGGVANMSAAPELARTLTVTTPGAPARPPAIPGRADPPALARRLSVRLSNEWLPRAAWTISRTGRLGLVGIGLLLAAALFLFSTHLKVAADIEALRADLAAAQSETRTVAADKVADPATALRALPARTDMPAILRQLFNKATQARLAVNTGKYEINATRSSGVVRYQIAFPVTGPYPQIRAFIDATLATMPAVALSDLVLDRKAIADGNVDAQIRMTVYTVATGTIGLPGAGPATAVPGGQASAHASEARPASDRVVAPTRSAALFAQHSWYVLPPAPPPAPSPPPPEPTAPPFPYTFVGSFGPEGDRPVFFLAQGDRVIDARVGDRLDGVYQFESAAGGQLVFVYLPLNIRHTLAAGASQ